MGLSPTIDCTIILGTAASGTCRASYSSGTSVTLAASATNGTFDSWSGACSGTGLCALTMSADRSVKATFVAPPGSEAMVGKWDPPTSMTVIGLHLSRLSGGNLLLWGHGGEPQTWNAGDGSFTEVVNNTCSSPTTCELFCSGHTLLADGRLLVAGGHYQTATAGGNGYGLKQSSIFDGLSWSATGSMTYARWYPTLVELDNGDVVAISGTQEPGLNASYPERYNGVSWTTLTAAQLSVPIYPRAFLEPKNGWIYYAGEGAPRYLDPNGSGAWSSAPSRVVANRQYGSAVMLDGKVLYVGGGGHTCPALPQNTAEMVDLNAAAPTWTAVASMAFRRRQTNATILPDGTVLVTGGTSACGATDESGAVFAAENYNRATNQWTTWANASVVRVYHSTTALLPDGRVFSTGSGDGGGVTQQYSYEIFSPPYLFKGQRPTYTLGSDAIHYGTPFTVQTPDGASTTKVTMIRLTSTTHAFDAGQRLNTLAFEKAADGQSLTVTPPASGRIAPPAPYLLFILNDQGVPSVAQTVLLSQ
ncbi:MAG: galactose oxidase-like domain-containing protein [Gemmatimonadales bacterium]